MEVDRHFVKEIFERKIVSILFVNLEEQLANVLTHAVSSKDSIIYYTKAYDASASKDLRV
ncbi:hypothetical protein DVH24_008268 [Malus domestica]|uniref:Uncharacterized protein n=1 Tax=Malus domestica TaxID=3750 RepID=A0A498JJ95_MALDO|nr:hypothetical protein DVH24_008268 [Malus domestica]